MNEVRTEGRVIENFVKQYMLVGDGRTVEKLFGYRTPCVKKIKENSKKLQNFEKFVFVPEKKEFFVCDALATSF